MIVACPSCARRYRLDPARVAGRPTITVRCPGCGATSTVEPPRAGDQTTRLAADAGLLPAPASAAAGAPELPGGLRVTIAVLEGKDSGRMFRVTTPSVVIGRVEGDLRLDDPEVSRRHACLRVYGGRVVLQDLGSTNGTFVGDRKISEEAIGNHAEFRLGATRLMLIMAREAGAAGADGEGDGDGSEGLTEDGR